MQAKTVVDVVLGEAVHGTRAERLEDMKAIASVIYNRAGGDVLSMQDVVKGRGQFGAYGKSLPPGAEAYRDLAEQAIREVVNNGPTTTATYYATPSAAGNLPGGLKTETQTKGHVFKSDPQGRPIVAAQASARRSTDSPLGIEPRTQTSELATYDRSKLDPSLYPIMDALAADPRIPADLHIKSGYRTREQNRAAKGAPRSQHLHGKALDIDTRGWTKEQKQALVETAARAGAKGFGLYSSGNTVHIDARPNFATWGKGGSYGGNAISAAPEWAQAALKHAAGIQALPAVNVAQANPLSPDTRSAIAATEFRMPALPASQQVASMLGGVPLGAPGARGAPALPQITRENAPPPTTASMLPTRGPNWTPPPLGTSAMMQPTPQPLGPPGQRNLTPREMGALVPAMPQTVPSQPSASIGLSMQPVGARGMQTQPPAPPLSAPREVGPAPNVAAAGPLPTGRETTAGRPLWSSPEFGNYSERSVTFPTDEAGKEWVTFPSVQKDGSVASEDQVRDYVLANGPVDPITGEVFPTFPSLSSATGYAKARSASLLDPTASGLASVLDPLGVSSGIKYQEAQRLLSAPRQVPTQPSTASPRRQGQGGAPMSGPAPGQSTQQAIGGIMAGKAPAGYSVRSASNPDVTITSFGPSLGYAHTNSKYGWTETYGPDGSKTTQYGKAVNVTVDPATGKPTIAYYTPDDAKWGYGLSPGLKARRSRQTAPTTFTPSFASPFSSTRGLGIANPARGLLTGLANLFAPKTEPMAYFAQQGPIGTAAGMGGLGGSFDNGFGPAGYGGPMGFSGAFSEGAHSNSTSSRGL